MRLSSGVLEECLQAVPCISSEAFPTPPTRHSRPGRMPPGGRNDGCFANDWNSFRSPIIQLSKNYLSLNFFGRSLYIYSGTLKP